MVRSGGAKSSKKPTQSNKTETAKPVIMSTSEKEEEEEEDLDPYEEINVLAQGQEAGGFKYDEK